LATTLNLCDFPPWVLGSRQFNDDPQPIQLQGGTTADRRFFAMLDATVSTEERAALFADYITVKFYLNEAEDHTRGARRALRNSYSRFLRGWGMDSNTPEGATLKGWVESRFGLAPTFHKRPLAHTIGAEPDQDYSPYDLDRTIGIARTNAIYGQFDLLYAFCQYELRRQLPSQRWLKLFRGTYDASEHRITERIDRRNYFVRLNNLSSFTSEVERAWEFGTTVWRVDVPIVKVFFYGELLPSIHLKGENEYLVIGGEYRVTEVWE
jgi:NAD+---dinitrogen-reductase ADP-D-ribosyltransferase